VSVQVGTYFHRNQTFCTGRDEMSLDKNA